MRIALNHSARSIETHLTNHPDITHIQADVSQTDPKRVPPTTLLIASPDCTNMTLAQGVSRREQAQLKLWEESV